MKDLAESGQEQWSFLVGDHIQLIFCSLHFPTFFFFESKWLRYFQEWGSGKRNCGDLFFEVRLKKGQGESLLKCGCLPRFFKMCRLCLQCLPRSPSASCVFQSMAHTLQLHLLSIFGQLCLTFPLLLANIWEIHRYSLPYLFHDGFSYQAGEAAEPQCCHSPGGAAVRANVMDLGTRAGFMLS